ncbi:MAG: clsA [Planctomycetaceae bacterium]|nr:clsA [Planctomycetaceae bacterium]
MEWFWHKVVNSIWNPPDLFSGPWANMLLGALLLLGHLLTLSLLPSVLMKKKRQPVSTVAWVLVIALVPYLGGLFYLIFGINRVERRTASKRRAAEIIAGHLTELGQYHVMVDEIVDERSRQMARLACRLSVTRPTFGNSIEIIPKTTQTLAEITAAVNAAEHSVHLEYYIWQPDETGTELRNVLIKKAREGLKIRFLYDAVGSSRLTRHFLQPMRDAGITVASFLPGPTFRERWSINLRSHRKIVVVDGNIGFTGGMNIGDEYLGKNPQFGYWRDTHLMMRGPSVLQLQQVFVEDWFFATGEKLLLTELFPDCRDSGDQTAQVIAGGPDNDQETLHALFFGAVNEAEQRITLVTSYFVPTLPLVAALETAARRGVRVRLLLSGSSAHYTTILAARSYYDTLLACGVEIYEYTGGMLHSKTLTIDGRWSFVGTPNFDARSLLLNFEVGVILYEKPAAEALEEQFEQDLTSAKRIHLQGWNDRPWRTVLAENFCRMFSPVL